MTPERWDQIQDLFDRALAIDPPVRADFLREAAADDGDLRREVETLLKAEAESGGFMEDALGEGLDLLLEDETADPSRFGKYEILEKIGEGGFGKVYRGRDSRLERNVAIKTCTAKDPSLRQRFFREAKISAGLQHPKIVTIHDYGELDDLPYLVQELLGGEDLDQQLDRRAEVSAVQGLDYLSQIAEGLAYAHGQGVLHRDIKPQNVRVLPGGQIKILDFGIACLVSEQERLTGAFTTVGTVGFIAPEQLQGEDHDERSDVFAFGVLAYELFALERPFPGKSFAEISSQILHQDPEPLGRLRPDLPTPLTALIHRCLAKRPGDRCAGFQGIVGDLAVISRGAGDPAGRASSHTRSSVRWAAASWLGAVVLGWVAIAWFWQPGEDPPPRPGRQEIAEIRAEAPSEPDNKMVEGSTSLPVDDLRSLKNRFDSKISQGLEPGAPAETSDLAPDGGSEIPSEPIAAVMTRAETSQPEPPPPADPKPSVREEPVESPPAEAPEPEEEIEAPEAEQPPPEEPPGAGTSDGGPSAVLMEVVKTVPTELPEPVLIHRPYPQYPALAQRRRQEAEVTVAVLVDAVGSVQNALVSRCTEPGLGFEEAAREAALEASFRPARRDGEAIQAWTEVTFEFKMPE